jgi:O-antigen/teichoic acid export membrane protein
LAISLLLTLVALAPVEAFDALLIQLLATFGGAKAVFLRRHVLGPGLRLTAVSSVVFLQADVHSLALGYLFAGGIGVAVYTSLLVHLFRRQGILSREALRNLEIPFRDILGFSLPLLSTDLFFLVRTALLVLLIEYFHNAEALAEFRAVVPVTRLNILVQVNFAYLFIPMAARLFARGADTAVANMYWKSHGRALLW